MQIRGKCKQISNQQETDRERERDRERGRAKRNDFVFLLSAYSVIYTNIHNYLCDCVPNIFQGSHKNKESEGRIRKVRGLINSLGCFVHICRFSHKQLRVMQLIKYDL